ncbi:MAG: GNAT family N-acetyltransferase [Deltaproteobacteria bacterium]|nr:MAG: GNAT family N-acetyltransferase [Deltaproteobacteria bacterium]
MYQCGGGLAAHRVLAVAEDGTLLVRADHLSRPLERIPPARVVGTLRLEAPMARLLTGPPLGRWLGTALCVAARPAPLRLARRLADLAPRTRGEARIEPVRRDGLRDGESAALAADLGRVGLTPRVAGLDAVSELLARGAVAFARDGAGRPVGAVRLDPVGEGAYVAIGLRRRWQRKGIGSALLDWAVGEASRRPFAWLRAEIRRDDVSSRALFRRAGFRLQAADLRRYGDGTPIDCFEWRPEASPGPRQR